MQTVIGIVDGARGHRHALGLIGCRRHLIGIPIGGKVAEVDDLDIGAYALDFLSVPQWESVVIAVAEYDGIGVYRIQVVGAEVARGVAAAAIMVVPCLRHHLQRHGNTYEHGRYDAGVTVGRSRRNLKGVVIFGFDGYSGGRRCGSGGGSIVSTAFLGKGLPEQRVDAVGYGRHTHAYPDSKGVERPRKGVVTFARLSRNLIEVKHNGYTGHKE
ncbi:unknown [Prevotella sp. CAG:873]|nr:unknown [Prevotella sp. CAG:873]